MMAEHYRDTGKVWKGMPLYACGMGGCAFDSTNALAMESHWQRFHEPDPPEMVPTGFVDAQGTPILKAWDPQERDWKD